MKKYDAFLQKCFYRRGGVMEGSVKDLSMYRLAVEKYLTENSRD